MVSFANISDSHSPAHFHCNPALRLMLGILALLYELGLGQSWLELS